MFRCLGVQGLGKMQGSVFWVWDQTGFGRKCFWTKVFLDESVFWTKVFLDEFFFCEFG